MMDTSKKNDSFPAWLVAFLGIIVLSIPLSGYWYYHTFYPHQVDVDYLTINQHQTLNVNCRGTKHVVRELLL